MTAVPSLLCTKQYNKNNNNNHLLKPNLTGPSEYIIIYNNLYDRFRDYPSSLISGISYKILIIHDDRTDLSRIGVKFSIKLL